jgi:hypothetical protein
MAEVAMKKLGLGLVGILLTIVLAVAWTGRDRSANQASVPVDVTPAAPPTGEIATVPNETLPALPTTPMVPSGLPVTADPDEYAKAIAAAVFAQDTVATDPEDHRASLMSQADPLMSARGRADLERMVAERIPTPEQWQRMRANDQWSQWTTDDVWQPGAWDEVLTSGQAEPGWVVRNVLGQQTVHFRDGGVQRETSRERTLTIGMRCPATGAGVARCWLTLVGVGVVS